MKKKILFYSLLILLFIQTNIISADFYEIIKNYKYIKCESKPIYRKSKNVLHTHPHKPTHATGTSLNWSGYAALTSFSNPTIGSVTNASGAFVVPNITVTSGNKYCAIWVGIDGFASPTVEQIGIEVDSFNGAPRTYAWWEIFPAQSNQIVNFPVEIGDVITAHVSFIGNNVFMLSIVNHTRGIATTVPTSQTTLSGAHRSSAEWIVEAPSLNNSILPLTRFATIQFHSCVATINGINGSINNSNRVNQAITMINAKRQARSIPSALSPNGKRFTVSRQVNPG